MYSTKASRPGEIVDDGNMVPSLASSGLDFTGTIAVLPLGTMGALTQGVRVMRHGKGQGSFSYTPPPGTAGKGHLNIPYYFEGSCSLLDSEGEWCVETSTNVVSMWLEGCKDPNTSGVKLRGKARDYLLSVKVKKTKIVLEGVVLWGGTFAAAQADVVLSRALMSAYLNTPSS